MRLKVVDLFCGAGGLSQGFLQAGYEVVGGTDVDPDACATYARNFLGRWSCTETSEHARSVMKWERWQRARTSSWVVHRAKPSHRCGTTTAC